MSRQWRWLTIGVLPECKRRMSGRDFQAVVAEDACATLSDQLHRASLDVIGLAFGRVARTEEIVGKLEDQAGASAMSVSSA